MENRIRIILLLGALGLLAGCQSAQRTTPTADPAVRGPEESMPMEDKPPVADGPYRPAVNDEDKSALIYQAQLDLLRVLICSQEQIKLSDESVDSDYALQRVSEHFTDMGFRVLDGSPCPAYSAAPEELRGIANNRDVDIFVVLKVAAQQRDKFGKYYSFEAEGRGKVLQISDKELLTTKSSYALGTRKLREQAAAETALVATAKELGSKLTDEILRKSARGALLRRVRVTGLTRASLVDYVRVGLQEKPGIHSVTLSNWDRASAVAVFWVRMDASVKENIAAYLEQLDNIKLKVQRLDNTGTDTSKRGLLDF
jgi:hypothetical protein